MKKWAISSFIFQSQKVVKMRLHEVAYLPLIVKTLNVHEEDFDAWKNSMEKSLKMRAYLRDFAKEWKFSKSEGAVSLSKVIEGELISNFRSIEAWELLNQANEIELLKKKIKWLQEGLDSGKFCNSNLNGRN